MKVRPKRGKSVRYQKNPKTQFFKQSNPFSNDGLLRNRAENLSGDKELRYKQSAKNRNPDLPKHKRQKEQEILEKENNKNNRKK